MTRVEMYRKNLKKTAALLRTKYLSATELAEACEISRQGAYGRIAALKELGLEVEEKIDRVKSKGPECVLYKITSGHVPEKE